VFFVGSLQGKGTKGTKWEKAPAMGKIPIGFFVE
jgi:hypothetical protein